MELAEVENSGADVDGLVQHQLLASPLGDDKAVGDVLALDIARRGNPFRPAAGLD